MFSCRLEEVFLVLHCNNVRLASPLRLLVFRTPGADSIAKVRALVVNLCVVAHFEPERQRAVCVVEVQGYGLTKGLRLGVVDFENGRADGLESVSVRPMIDIVPSSTSQQVGARRVSQCEMNRIIGP